MRIKLDRGKFAEGVAEKWIKGHFQDMELIAKNQHIGKLGELDLVFKTISSVSRATMDSFLVIEVRSRFCFCLLGEGEGFTPRGHGVDLKEKVSQRQLNVSSGVSGIVAENLNTSDPNEHCIEPYIKVGRSDIRITYANSGLQKVQRQGRGLTCRCANKDFPIIGFQKIRKTVNSAKLYVMRYMDQTNKGCRKGDFISRETIANHKPGINTIKTTQHTKLNVYLMQLDLSIIPNATGFSLDDLSKIGINQKHLKGFEAGKSSKFKITNKIQFMKLDQIVAED